MGEVALSVVKWTVRLSIIISLALAFIILINLAYSLVNTTVNQSVIGDMLGFAQMWMPFNLDPVITWVFTASILYLTYRVVLFISGFVNKFIGEN